MIPSLLLTLPAALAPAAPAPLPPAILGQDADEYDTKLAEAGEDVDKLWELQKWCKEQGRNSDARKVLKKIVSIDGENEAARKALGHHFYDGKWFSSRTELSVYRRAEEKRMRDEKGLIRMGDEWVPIAEAPFRRMGWAKDEETGRYLSPGRTALKVQEAKYREEGYQQQDLNWVHPDDFDKWREGLWKCGEEWKTAEEADAYHANIATAWRIPSEKRHFVLMSTCKREAAWLAAWWADQTYSDLVRLYGVKPHEAPTVVVVNGVDQYNTVAAGSQELGIPPSENSGWSSIHHAFFGEMLFDATSGSPEYNGSGVCYYDENDPKLKPWGQHAVRHAAALSYAEKIDPSWDAISRMVSNAGSGGQAALGNFWEEKKIPMWMRYGGASFVERYFHDPYAENKDWATQWPPGLHKEAGGPRPLKDVFATGLDAADMPGSSKWLNETGLVVSFILNGRNADVSAAHGAFKQALKSGGDTEAAVEALQEALLKHEGEPRKYAGME